MSVVESSLVERFRAVGLTFAPLSVSVLGFLYSTEWMLTPLYNSAPGSSGLLGSAPPIPVACTRCLAVTVFGPLGVLSLMFHVLVLLLNEEPAKVERCRMFKLNVDTYRFMWSARCCLVRMSGSSLAYAIAQKYISQSRTCMQHALTRTELHIRK